MKPDHILDILGPIIVLLLPQNLDIFTRRRKTDRHSRGGWACSFKHASVWDDILFNGSYSESLADLCRLSGRAQFRCRFLFPALKDSRAYTPASVPPTREQMRLVTCSGSMRVPHWPGDVGQDGGIRHIKVMREVAIHGRDISLTAGNSIKRLEWADTYPRSLPPVPPPFPPGPHPREHPSLLIRTQTRQPPSVPARREPQTQTQTQTTRASLGMAPSWAHRTAAPPLPTFGRADDASLAALPSSTCPPGWLRIQHVAIPFAATRPQPMLDITRFLGRVAGQKSWLRHAR